MPEKLKTVQVRLKGLKYEEAMSLHDFLEAQQSVKRIQTRMVSMDAAYDPIRVPNPAQIKGFIFQIVGGYVGKKVLDVVADLVREWQRQRKIINPDAEIAILFGSNNRDIV